MVERLVYAEFWTLFGIFRLCHCDRRTTPVLNQTPKMRPGKMSVLLLAGMAVLFSTDANASGSFVDVRSVDLTITVELRYAGSNNFLEPLLYPLGTRSLALP